MWLVLLLDCLIINLLCLQIFMHFPIYKCISFVVSFLVITVIQWWLEAGVPRYSRYHASTWILESLHSSVGLCVLI